MNTTSPSLSAQSMDELIHGLQIVQFTRYARISAICIILYDYIITLDQEASRLTMDDTYSADLIPTSQISFLKILQKHFDAPLGFSVTISSTLCNRMILKVHGILAADDNRRNSRVLPVSSLASIS
ncbi:hypothetical protein CVT25_011529 [Psilocybe cyanescens]|uniref:DUF6533 domain-containing protein n=1 Tax=Psilocybe cyanescens TaxID=93625 RepID=A0A409XWG9_PSICY|nr:hypothetical protein CVT25_011529 [Psilocybe cyanescens]